MDRVDLPLSDELANTGLTAYIEDGHLVLDFTTIKRSPLIVYPGKWYWRADDLIKALAGERNTTLNRS